MLLVNVMCTWTLAKASLALLCGPKKEVVPGSQKEVDGRHVEGMRSKDRAVVGRSCRSAH
jgi:hypothetical protein